MPCPFFTIGSDAGIYYIRSTGFVDYCYISYNIVSARPVINLKADTPFTNDRDGSKDKPFTVKLD